MLRSLSRWSPRPDSDECNRFLEQQIHKCTTSHAACHMEEAGMMSLPRRVVHLGNMGNGDARLIHSNGLRGKYAALSHSWGSFQPIRTLQANEAAMKHTIPWEALSEVFRDAIRLCRKLQIYYLWIDSLCIVQDSALDWETESAKMCDYYENAYLTISATSSPNGTVPFLSMERDKKYAPQKFEIPDSVDPSAAVYARRYTGDSSSRPADGVDSVGPLAQRAWVWQETVLSARVLHYTRSELVWDCRAECVSEDGSVPRVLDSMRLASLMPQLRARPHRAWATMLQSYTPRRLTYPADRLPAASGLAARMSAILSGSRYYAGLWGDDVLRGLCWSVDYISSHAELTRPPPPEYIAPSWSWASVYGAISPYLEDMAWPFVPLAAVVDIDCHVPGSNPWGRVSGGSLTLRGMVAEITVTCHDPLSCWAYTIGDNPEEREPLTADCILAVGDQGHIGRQTADGVLKSFQCRLPCILLGEDRVGDHENDGQVYVMVLGTLHTGGSYSRIGLAILTSSDWFDGAVEKDVVIV